MWRPLTFYCALSGGTTQDIVCRSVFSCCQSVGSKIGDRRKSSSGLNNDTSDATSLLRRVEDRSLYLCSHCAIFIYVLISFYASLAGVL